MEDETCEVIIALPGDLVIFRAGDSHAVLNCLPFEDTKQLQHLQHWHNKQLKVNNPRVSQKTRTQAHETLAFMQAVPPMEVPAIATYVNSQLMTNTATLLNGERFGS